MSPLVFLLIALAISVLGSLVLWWRTRRPRRLTSGIEEFTREMQALAPPDRSSSRRSGPRAEG